MKCKVYINGEEKRVFESYKSAVKYIERIYDECSDGSIRSTNIIIL